MSKCEHCGTDAASVAAKARAAGLTEGIDLAWQHIRQYFADNPNANGRDLLAAAEKAWNADRLTRADAGHQERPILPSAAKPEVK